jgi:hypothetical protein
MFVSISAPTTRAIARGMWGASPDVGTTSWSSRRLLTFIMNTGHNQTKNRADCICKEACSGETREMILMLTIRKRPKAGSLGRTISGSIAGQTATDPLNNIELLSLCHHC